MTEAERKAMAAEVLRQIMAGEDPGLPSEDVRRGVVGPNETARTIAQGLTFGGADEIEAFARSRFGGDDYGTELERTRSRVQEFKQNNPNRALAAEIAGVAVPAVVGMGLSGGAGGPGVIGSTARAVGAGAAEGGLYGFLDGEGGFGPRAGNAAMGAVGGAAGGGLGYLGVRGGGEVFNRFIDYSRRKFGDRVARIVENEMTRAIRDSGMTVDEAIERVGAGELVGEMNQTLRSVARGYLTQSRGAGEVLRQTYESRPGQLRQETMDYLQRGLVGEGDDNVLRAVRQGEGAAKAKQSQEYERIFQGIGDAPDEVVSAMTTALRRRPQAASDAADLYRAQTGKNPYFRVEDGKVIFDRRPTLREAEMVQRALGNDAGRLRTQGSGEVSRAVKGVQSDLRSVIDENAVIPRGVRTQFDSVEEMTGEGVRGRFLGTEEFADGLGGVRAKWAKIETNREIFDEARKALSRSPDEVAIAFEAASQKGPEAVKSFRAGVMDAYRRKATTGSKASMPRLLADEERKEGAILRIVFPEDELPGILERAGRAQRAQDAANEILGGSQTAVSQGRALQTAGGVAQDTLEAYSGNVGAMIRMATSALRSVSPQLNDKQVQQLASMMVESNPDVLRKALTDTRAVDTLYNLADNTVKRVAGATGAVSGGAAYPALEGLLGGN